MSVLELVSSRHPAHIQPRDPLEGFRMWRARRRMQRIERLAARQLASLSPHMLSDIGLPAPERDRSRCLRLWTGGAT
jgi:uncharacterized protein YjiS (DUF1127 family)